MHKTPRVIADKMCGVPFTVRMTSFWVYAFIASFFLAVHAATLPSGNAAIIITVLTDGENKTYDTEPTVPPEVITEAPEVSRENTPSLGCVENRISVPGKVNILFTTALIIPTLSPALVDSY